MEVFVDLGLFELLAALGLSALARQIYSHRIVGGVFLVASVALPALLIYVATTEELRWLSAAALGTALVNATVVAGALQRGEVPTLTFARRRRRLPP